MKDDGLVRKQKLNSRGYPQITLSKNGRKHTFLIHRLVAMAFVKNPNKYKEVNHKDGNKLNNKASNLEWVTRSENLIHAIKLGLKVMPKYTRNTHPNAKLKVNDIDLLRAQRISGFTYKEIGEYWGISIATAHKIYNNANNI
jgi:hypothetical protein